MVPHLLPIDFGNANSAYSFDGVDDNISIADNAVFNFTSYSISVWFKYNAPGTAGKSIWSLISKNAVGNGFDDAFHMWVNATTKELGGRVGNGSLEFYLGNPPAVDNGQWHQSILVFDNSNNVVNLYLDGVLISSVVNTSNPFNNGSNIKIGFWEAFNNYFNGYIDDIKIYNTALTPSQVAAEYTSSSLVASYPFTGNANDAVGTNNGTVNGATLTTDRFGNANSAYSFDGVDDFIGIGSLNFATNDYTISYWVNVNTNNADIAVVSGNDPAALNQTFIMSGFSGGVGRFLHRNPSGATGGVNLAGIQALTLGQWKFITCIKQGTTLTYYVNGVADNTITDVAATNISSAISLEFGRLMSSAFTPIYHLNGKIDEVKIYNTALSAAQVLADYTNATQITLPIAVLSGGTQGTCNSANSNNMNGGTATGVGCGGGGAGYWGGHGGAGYFGGGGGGAAGLNAPNRIGGDGGSGAIAMALANSGGTILSNIFLVSGNSFTIPIGVSQVKVFAIGAGGGGAGATSADGTSGGGGAAGGIAYKKYTVTPGDVMTYEIGIGGIGGIDANNGSAGTNTTATINGVSILGNGGTGGYYNNGVDALGGNFSGGDGGAVGGSGKGISGDNGGGAGGGIAGGYNASVTCSGGVGADAQNIDILFGILSNTATNIDNLPNLIAYYKFNNTSADSSGNNLHGTIIGSPTFTVDRNGNANSAISFNGNTANRIEVDDNILLHTPSITIGAWVKFNSLGSIKTIVDKPLGSNVSDSWHFGTENGNFSCWHFNSTNTYPYTQVTSAINTNQWYYVVNTFDDVSKQHKLYVDGLLKATNTFNSTIGYDNSKLYIGAAIENGGLNFPMDGEIDEVKIYGSALTASQILDEFENEVVANKPGSGDGISLDGSNDYVQLPSVLDGATQFTVDFWIKTAENRSSGTYWQKPSILGNGNPSGPDGDFGISTSNGFIGVWHGFCCGDQSFETTKAINDNQWHHVAAVNDGSNVVLFVDGIQQAGSIPTGGGALQNAARPWRLGMINSCCSGDTPHQGTLDEFRIWNTHLTQTQIRDRMCKKIVNTDALYSNLSAYYNFNEKIGSTVFDGSANSNTATLHNGASRITSGAPIGNTSSHDYSGASASVNLANPTRGDDVTITLTSGSAQGVQVYNVNEAPNSRSGVEGLETNDGYFGTFIVGGTSPTFNTVYNYDGISSISDENALSLFSRNDNSTNSWLGESATLNATANTLTKNAISATQKEFIIGANDPGNISSNQSSCAATIPNPLTGTSAYNGALGVTYQWQDSSVNATWQNISGATNTSPLILPLASTPKYYRRLATLGSLTLSSNIVFLDIKDAIALNIIPTNQWNLYAYEGTSVDSVNVTYKGSYTRNTLGVNTITDYGSGNNPSTASGYAGCSMTTPNNTYSLYAIRKGFPTGSYALNIPQHDDELKIYKDGILLTSAACCNNMGSQYFTLTTLDANSVIECRMTNSGGGPGHMVVDIFLQNLTGGTIGSNQTNCTAFTPSLLSNNHPAYGGASTTILYQWQMSNDNINYTNISGATSLTYQPSVVNNDTYFRRKAMNANNEEAFSNVVLMDINGPTFYADLDGDGFGDPTNVLMACSLPSGYTTDNTDCNDNSAIEHPGQVWYLDADGDGYGIGSSLVQCNRPTNRYLASELIALNGDCNDNHAHIHPGAQYLTFTGAPNYTNQICFPLTGDSYTNFRYEVMYFNIYNEMPENGAPRLSVDLNQDFILDAYDKRLSMQPEDVNDTNTSDGKKYFLIVNGIQPSIPIQSYVSPHLINCDYFGPFLNVPQVFSYPNLRVLAKDISFSNYNPDVSSSVTVTAHITNPSDFDALNIPIRLVNQFDTTQQFPIQIASYIPAHNAIDITWTITTPALSGLCPMKVVVDYGNTLNETNENDNTAIRGFINGTGSLQGGISVTSAVSPKTIIVNNGNAVNATIIGHAGYTGLAMTLNDINVPGAEVQCTIVETGLTFNGTTDANGNFSISFEAPIGAGTYHVMGTVSDFTWSGAMEPDSNEFTVVPNTVLSTMQPDITFFTANESNSLLLAGDVMKIKYGSLNQGTIASTQAHKIKLTITGPSGFLVIDSFMAPTLLVGEFSSLDSIVTSPLTVGDYYVSITTDADDEISESDEANNSNSFVLQVQPANVDLLATASSTATPVICSNQVLLTTTIKNQGTIATSSSTTATVAIMNNSTTIASITENIPVIQGGSEYQFGHTFSIPFLPASYSIVVNIDNNNTIAESNETNNVNQFQLSIDTCKPDLLLADFCNNVNIASSSPDYSGTVTLNATIRNEGTRSLNTPVTVRFHFSNGSYVDALYTQPILPQETAMISVPASIPSNASSISVEIDPLNVIDETNNSNNTSASSNLGWDIAPEITGCSNGIAAYNYHTGGFIHLYAHIRSLNLYKQDSVTVNFKISGPGITGQLDMGNAKLYNVVPTCLCPVIAAIPSVYLISQQGTYHVYVTVDPNNAIAETNEANNIIDIPIVVQDLPDMKMQSSYINPSSLNPIVGQSITTEITYENTAYGNINDVMKLKLLIDNVVVDSISNASGLVQNGTTTIAFTTPWSSMQPGVHLIKAMIDADNTIAETDENNNIAVRPIIVGDAANMYFDSLGSVNLYPALHDSALIYAKITNNGTLTCNSLVTFYFLNDFNDTLQIRSQPITLNGNSDQILQFKWKVLDEKTVVYAAITNSSVQEFDYTDNRASFAFGKMKLITESLPACFDNNKGTLTAHILGGNPPFTYSWSNGDVQSTLLAPAGTYNVTVLDATGQQVDGMDSIKACTGTLVKATCFLQGYYAANGIMESVLNHYGIICPTVYTDTITIELHDNSPGYALSSSSQAILHSNGMVYGEFPLSEIGSSKYVVIKHRSSLETWSAAPVHHECASRNLRFFSTAASQAFGDNQTRSMSRVCICHVYR
jgi:hypothetical protein